MPAAQGMVQRLVLTPSGQRISGAAGRRLTALCLVPGQGCEEAAPASPYTIHHTQAGGMRVTRYDSNGYVTKLN